MKYTLQVEGKSPCHLWVWSIKNSSWLLFGKKKPRKCVKDIKVLPREECITQRKPLVCDFKIRNVSDTKRKLVRQYKKRFKVIHQLVQSKYTKRCFCVAGYWIVLKGALLEAAEGLVDGQKTQLDIKKDRGGIIMLVKVLVRNGNHGRSGNGNTSKEKYLETKKN